MPISLRIPPETNSRLQALADKKGKTKTELILEALVTGGHFFNRRDEKDRLLQSAGLP